MNSSEISGTPQDTGPDHFSQSTQLFPAAAQVSDMDCTPQGLCSYLFAFESLIPDSSGMMEPA